MHKYRTAARQQAWYNDEDEASPNLNPFSKIRPRRKADEENGLRPLAHSQSEPAVPKLQDGEKNESNGPHHAATMPSSSAGASGTSTVKDSAIEEKTKDPSQDSGTGTSETIIEEETPGGPAPGPRRRLRFLDKMSHRHTENSDMERTTTSESKRPKQHFTVMSQIRATIFNSWINVLLICVPVGIAVNYAHIDPVGIFVVNFIAIIPLAAMLSFATEEIALRTGETIGGLLNATFGNAVELIVSIIALVATPPEIVIVQTSLIGSMLSNLLLVLGMCFAFGGYNRLEQHFNVTVAQTAASLLTLAVGSLIIPAAFHAWATGAAEQKGNNIAALSRGTAVLLLLVYGAYLYFQLKTHADMYNEPSKKVEKNKSSKKGDGDATKNIALMGAGISASSGGPSTQQNPSQQPEDEREMPQLHIYVAIATLAISTALVGVCAEYMVDSIDDLVIRSNGKLSKTFVGLILLPIVGNAAEHATAVTVAIKDKMDLAIGVAVGSSMQIALLIVPFVVVLGWCIGNEDMNLDFDGFQIAVLFVAVLLVNYLIGDGKSHWLEGVLLITLYLIIAVAAWYYPPAPEAGEVAAR